MSLNLLGQLTQKAQPYKGILTKIQELDKVNNGKADGDIFGNSPIKDEYLSVLKGNTEEAQMAFLKSLISADLQDNGKVDLSMVEGIHAFYKSDLSQALKGVADTLNISTTPGATASSQPLVQAAVAPTSGSSAGGILDKADRLAESVCKKFGIPMPQISNIGKSIGNFFNPNQKDGSASTLRSRAGDLWEGAKQAVSPGKPGQAQQDSIYKKHAQKLGSVSLNPSEKESAELKKFKENYEQNKERYEKVAQATGIPAKLIAALHWRESSGNFDTYLHQGDPLGKPAVHVPSDIPVFHKWEDAAIHALNSKKQYRDKYGLSANSTDMAAMASFAERYNGTGYHDKGKTNPYVYSYTTGYEGGKYVADGQYSASAKDSQPGVIAMMSVI